LQRNCEVGDGLGFLTQIERQAATQAGKVAGDRQPLATGDRHGTVQQVRHVSEVRKHRTGKDRRGVLG
jgi:hypothetical protein